MSTKEVLRFGGVRALLISNGVLFTGVSLQAAALGLQAYGISGREADLGWIGLCEFLPAALLVLVTGTVADRFNRKRIAVIAICGEVACGVALTWYATTDPTDVRPLFFIAFAYGIARAFLAPATRPMPPMVAPEGGIPQVIAMYSATWTGATILGPALSGLLFAWDPAAAYCASTVLVVIAGKLNASTGPVHVMLPVRGISVISAPGQPFHLPAADEALFTTLKAELRRDIQVKEVDCNINDAAYAETAAKILLQLIALKPSQ